MPAGRLSDERYDRRIAALRAREIGWLRRAGLAGRSWLIFGAAPEPVLPRSPEEYALVFINNAALTARRLGLPDPDLTIRSRREHAEELRGFQTRNLLWLTRKSRLLAPLAVRRSVPMRIGRLHVLSLDERDALVDHVFSEGIRSAGPMGKPSTGVTAVAYALFCGVPHIVLTGVSVSQDGHSYDARGAKHLHREEDRYALAEIARRKLAVKTSEAKLHEATGLPLVG